ncbi:MAG: SRPBCC domain-containing protein [Phenylobacterium sp.]
MAGQFLFATPTGQMIKVEIDPRVGGRFNFTERRPEMGDVEHVGEYLVIERPQRLVFSFKVPAFSDESTTVALDFAPDGDGTRVALTHEGVLEEYAERTEGGWGTILERLDQLV